MGMIPTRKSVALPVLLILLSFYPYLPNLQDDAHAKKQSQSPSEGVLASLKTQNIF
jgi:hypothetical protein